MKSNLHRLIPFLAFILQLQLRKLDSIQFLRSKTRSSTLHFRLDYSLHSTTTVLYSVTSSVSFYNASARTTQETTSLLLTNLVHWSVAKQRTSFCCTRTLSGNKFTESLPSNGYRRVIFCDLLRMHFRIILIFQADF
jgi:hypothetical protein